jgi:hypothetical protein
MGATAGPGNELAASGIIGSPVVIRVWSILLLFTLSWLPGKLRPRFS